MKELEEAPEIYINEFEDNTDVFNFGREMGKFIANGERLPQFDLNIDPKKRIALSLGVIVGFISK